MIMEDFLILVKQSFSIITLTPRLCVIPIIRETVTASQSLSILEFLEILMCSF